MVPALDGSRVRKHLEDIALTLQVLEGLQSTSLRDFCGDLRTQWATEKGLERCIQNVLDVSAHILNAFGHPAPDDYTGLIRELGRQGILPADFAERIAPMAGFRNILVHRYLDVDVATVYDALQRRLDDFRVFARHISGFLTINEL